MKLFVLGASGFLGREVVFSALRRGFGVTAIFHETEPVFPPAVRKMKMDLERTDEVESLILQEFPNAVINCAAIISIAVANANPERAERLNVALPRRLAMLANHISERLVHVSTDMVFDGTKGNYEHTDTPMALSQNLYAQTKLLGEKEVLKYGKSNATVVRVPVISGNSQSGAKSLHERLFAMWARGETANLFAEEIRQPVSVSNLADVLVELCERPNLSGVYHWAGTDAMSRAEIGERIAEHFGLSPQKFVKRISYDDVPGARETRPRDLSFSLNPLAGKLKTRAQPFDEILAEMRVPDCCAAWFEAETGRRVVRRLIKGVDF
ncbi:MAG: SDR family oxidoreductase [Opitutae bacterium]|nr:SDR family oxidoreductase [Opitutae bacterium]MCD8298165.1 SDR family oxidoreductase [Opitutae bacterium]